MPIFRWQRGSLADSMKTVTTVATTGALLEHIRHTLPATVSIQVKPYCWDARIGWDTHLVLADGLPVGFTSAILLKSPPQSADKNPMNMSYCRFQNTLTDLRDCYEALEATVEGESDALTDQEERDARVSLIALAMDIVSLIDIKEPPTKNSRRTAITIALAEVEGEPS